MNPEDLKTAVFQCRVYILVMAATVIPLSLAGWTTTVLCVVIPTYLLLFNLFLMCYWGARVEGAGDQAGPLDNALEGGQTLP